MPATRDSESERTRAPALRRARGEGMALVRRLRDPGSGLLGQGLRFAIAGGVVSAVYLGVTILLADLVGLRFQVALLIGFGCGLTLHFTLQRFFVWSHAEEFALPFHHQAGRYLVVAGTQYGLTAASTSTLPGALGLPTELVYVITVMVLVAANFLVFRHGVFHAKASGASPRLSLDGLDGAAKGRDRSESAETATAARGRASPSPVSYAASSASWPLMQCAQASMS